MKQSNKIIQLVFLLALSAVIGTTIYYEDGLSLCLKMFLMTILSILVVISLIAIVINKDYDYHFDYPRYSNEELLRDQLESLKSTLKIKEELIRISIWVDVNSGKLPPVDKQVVALRRIGDSYQAVITSRTTGDARPSYGIDRWLVDNIEYWLDADLPNIDHHKLIKFV